MIHSASFRLPIAAGLLVLAACKDNTPTEPDIGPGVGASGSPSLVLAGNSWTTKADLPTPRWGLTAAVINNASGSILYAIGGVIGGFTAAEPSQSVGTVTAYNIATNTWTRKASLPTPLYFTNGVGVIGGKIYISGGLSLPAGDDLTASKYSHSTYVYDPALNRWAQKAALPRNLARGISGVISGKLYVLNGACSTKMCTSPRLYRYNPATNTWDTSLRSSPAPHIGGAGGVINGRFYVVGGDGPSGSGIIGTNRLHVYNPATNQWTEKASMPTARTDIAAVVLGGRLYVIGGVESNDGQWVGTMEVYNPATDSWTTKASMPTGRYALAAGRVIQNGQAKILAVGGAGGPGAREANEAYTP
jgi:N-acetylneuraminic acid mutarotase